MRDNTDNTKAWWWWSSWFSSRASPSTTEEEVLEEGEGCARGEVWLPSHPSTIYGGKGEGGPAPLDPIWWGGGGQGRWLAPQARGAPPLGFPPNPRRMGPRGGWRPAH